MLLDVLLFLFAEGLLEIFCGTLFLLPSTFILATADEVKPDLLCFSRDVIADDFQDAQLSQ